jgi:hypothetical protein
MPGNKNADEWANLAADKPDAYGVEFLGFGDRYGRRRLLPRSLTHLKRSITEPKCVEAKAWAEAKRNPSIAGIRSHVRSRTRFRPRLALRFYQLKTGHCPTGQYLH